MYLFVFNIIFNFHVRNLSLVEFVPSSQFVHKVTLRHAIANIVSESPWVFKLISESPWVFKHNGAPTLINPSRLMNMAELKSYALLRNAT
jgi:hypothetical protein